jgi:hypothetical protein
LGVEDSEAEQTTETIETLTPTTTKVSPTTHVTTTIRSTSPATQLSTLGTTIPSVLEQEATHEEVLQQPTAFETMKKYLGVIAIGFGILILILILTLVRRRRTTPSLRRTYHPR